MSFDEKALGIKGTRDKSLKKLLKSPAMMAFGISTLRLPESFYELCDRLKLLLQEEQARKNSDIFNEELIGLFDTLLEYKCISSKQ